MSHVVQCVRAIIIRDGKLLMIERNKYGEHYFVLPGGHVDPGETLEQALQRELLEEASMPLLTWRKVFVDSSTESKNGPQHIYLCEVDSTTEAVMSPDADEVKMNKLGENTYTLCWVALSDTPHMPIYSSALKQALVASIRDGFPDKPQTI